MLAVARAGRYGLLLSVLLVLVGLSTPAASGDPGHAERHGAAAIGASVANAPSTYDELHDRPRGSVTAGHAPTTASPDTWWVVRQQATGGCTPHRRSPAGEFGNAATTTATTTPPPSRAPPLT